ncbi:glycosyltransferase [Clostridium sp.]|uniref:glycosyltransferase family 2 protein n=1 Tax=Clostridium sp. TaxID=1506 RepID=UPI00260C0198|nr:glycosyltransferase family 2 protein [Clostridium sp.]
MIMFIEKFMVGVGMFYLIYILLYTSYLFLSVIIGAWQLYERDRMIKLRNELKHNYYLPISIIVPAYNEEVTIVDSIKSLLELNYKLYEIIVIDDGSSDNMVTKLIEVFNLKPINRPIHKRLLCKPYEKIYETMIGKIKFTLISKINGGKGDSINMGINASKFPYFITIDADSMLQKDSLEKIIQPVLEDESIVAVGGLIRVAQCVEIENGEVKDYHLPSNLITCMQVVEYDRSFLASRILMDQFNGNLIISGAFGLFKKDIVIAVGGYDRETLGEDMELVLKLHTFCRNNNKKYSLRYEPNAICWSQAPSSLKDLMKQRQRWYIGLFQCMLKYYRVFTNLRFGLVSFISYMYYLLFELLSPIIEIFGIITMIIAWNFRLLNISFMIKFFLLYSIYGSVLTITAFFQRIYTQNLKISFLDSLKAIFMCFLENIFFRYIISFVRLTSFIGYKNKKNEWGDIKRVKNSNKL